MCLLFSADDWPFTDALQDSNFVFTPYSCSGKDLCSSFCALYSNDWCGTSFRLLAGMRRRFFLPAWSDEKAALIWQPESQSGLRYTHTFVRITERHTRNTWHFSMTFQPITVFPKVNVLKGWTFPFTLFEKWKWNRNDWKLRSRSESEIKMTRNRDWEVKF